MRTQWPDNLSPARNIFQVISRVGLLFSDIRVRRVYIWMHIKGVWKHNL